MTNQEIRKAKRQQKIHRRNWLIYFLFIITIALALIIIGNLNTVMMMQTDTLNTLNDMRTDNEPIGNTEYFYPLTDEERDYIERVVASESRGEPYEGILAVAQVVRDRAMLWNMPISEVLGADKQFAPPYQGEVPQEVKDAVSEVFDDGTSQYEEPITHFYSGSEPCWAESKVNRGSISRHTFLY
jgi:spore germination cell wall hydrolase CwlJ-like protein